MSKVKHMWKCVDCKRGWYLDMSCCPLCRKDRLANDTGKKLCENTQKKKVEK